ncbi:MAG TPA: DNA-directed RNA polymerase subunit beta' [Planctomycetes bacterium]|nr:DNA-directed RNA polymerase subunit beta' [Planctomycetota bacterium]
MGLGGGFDLGRRNEVESVTIRLASPDNIRQWSYGEVKKPETINYRTYRSEKEGLFCERIFGPERDWECACGKYKGIKHKGIKCDRCGVEVTHSRVRRKRMGHINLAAPVAHIWFFKAMPSRLGSLLALKTSSLERVIYFQDYIVTDPGDTPLNERDLLTEEEYKKNRELYGDAFEAGMGAEAVKKLLERLELDVLLEQLYAELRETTSKQKTKDLIKRLKTVRALKESGNRPEWMVLDVIPVIPPDLRPLVLLESGSFATSDLNDLYRRLINRNNRLKKLLDLNAPEVIIRNEKRMLQQSVDALFDNNRCRRPVLGSNNRPLKSITDMIKGKQGRFRENLLGKRVDYSARSVIVVGPELKLHQCGLPKKIALELFQPFIIRRLKEMGHADTIKSAKKMLERKDEEVWDILEEVIFEHPVLLNRAPTLHRMGIQAFEPQLIEGNAIRLHPLVCAGFNADFDGDQMAVHLPLSLEAQVEACTLMLATNNIFSPANGSPIIAPSQDMVLGVFYLTESVDGETGENLEHVYANLHEVFMAYSHHKVKLQTRVRVRMPEGVKTVEILPSGERETRKLDKSRIVETTVGRCVFFDMLPEGMPIYNYPLKKGRIKEIIADCHKLLGRDATLNLLDDLKDIGFKYATLGGVSFATFDLHVPDEKATILEATQKEVDKIHKKYEKGEITELERYNQIIDRWTEATDNVGHAMMKGLANDQRDGKRYLNPIYMMTDSGARGSKQQVRQLAGMRGLMAKPSGEIIETPIRANFREGLHVLEYFSSTHGARKGLADTALKTADSGYLTRKLADVGQNVVINERDCGTMQGITKGPVMNGDRTVVTLRKNIIGRTACDPIADLVTGETIINAGEYITEEKAAQIESVVGKKGKIRVRSPLTCETPIGVCVMCYGADLSTGKFVEEGMAVGIIAAQSIGEPGTQLTMRTFHVGGVATSQRSDPQIRSSNLGNVRFERMNVVKVEKDTIELEGKGSIHVLDGKGRILESHEVPLGALVRVKNGDELKKSGKKMPILFEWDPFMEPILALKGGTVSYEGIIEGVTYKVERDRNTGIERKVIIEHKGDHHPMILISDPDSGTMISSYPIPERAHIEVEEGDDVVPGKLLAKTPREHGGTQDITGGLPRVTEIFEVRKPKNPAVMAEIDGEVEIGPKKRGKGTILIKSESGEVREHTHPQGRTLRVHTGDTVKAGDALTKGSFIPHDILRVRGAEALQNYLLEEVQSVYRTQNVTINDKHIEVIIMQMLRKVQVADPGDVEFLPGQIVDKFEFRAANRAIQRRGGKPATAEALLLGITKASLFSNSFISAASFQETTKVLTEAALAGRTDDLLGLKENVILGHMVPAGTGHRHYNDKVVEKLISEEELREQLAREEAEAADSAGAALDALGGATSLQLGG